MAQVLIDAGANVDKPGNGIGIGLSRTPLFWTVKGKF